MHSRNICALIVATIAAIFIAFAPPVGAAAYLEYNTQQTILVGPFLDYSDGVTPKTGIDISSGVTAISCEGVSCGDISNNTWSHVSSGFYSLTLDASDCNTYGRLIVSFSDPDSFVPVWHEFEVVPSNVYDSFGGDGSDTLDVNVATIAANAITATAINDGAITNAKVADDVDVDVNTIDGVAPGTALATADEMADAVWDEAMSGHTADGTFGGDFPDVDGLDDTATVVDAVWGEAQSGYTSPGTFGYLLDEAISGIDDNPWDATTRTLSASQEFNLVGNITGSLSGSVGSVTGAVGSVTAGVTLADDAITAAKYDESTAFPITNATGTQFTAIPWNAAWDAEAQSEATDALNAYDPPTATEMTSAFTEIKGATFSTDTDQLEDLRDRGDAAWTTATQLSGTVKDFDELITALDLDDTATVATAVVDEFETQSQADPTGFHVNMMEMGGESYTELATVEDIASATWVIDKDSPTADSYGWVMNTLLDVLAGRMKIDTSAYTMTWYDYDSDTTPSQVFYLFDSSGAYSTTNVYERDKDALP